jgi:O-antigen ligase
MEEAHNNNGQSGLVTDVEPDAPSSRLSRAVVFFLCAIVVFSIVAYGAVDFWALGFLSVLAAVVACLWCADAWRMREFRFNTSSLQLPIACLLAIGLIQLLPIGSPGVSGDQLALPASHALSLDPYATRRFVIHLAVYGIFFAAALTYIDHRDRLRKLVVFLIIFVSLMSFFAILQRLASLDSIYGLRSSTEAIPFGSFINQHHFAALMEMASGLTLGLLFGKATRKANRPLLIIAAVLMGIAIIFTGSRGGLISFFAVLGFILVMNFFARKSSEKTADEEGEASRTRGRIMMVAGGAALVLAMFFLVLLLGGDQSALRGIGLSGAGTQLDFTTGRSHFWGVAVQIFLAHPILGAGLDAFGNAFPLYDTWNGIYRVEQAHNDYLQILADGGILGFSCVAVFIFLFFKKSLRVIRDSRNTFRRNTAIGALAGCFGIMVHSFFDFPLRTPANAFFFLTLAALATVSIYYPPTQHRRRK